jgi:hypothetical protein
MRRRQQPPRFPRSMLVGSLFVSFALRRHRRRLCLYWSFGERMSTSSYEQELKEREVRQKQWDAVVAAAIKEVEDSVLKHSQDFHHTTFFGAMGIDPKHLAIWCFFTKDEDLKKAEKEHLTDAVNQAMREALRKHGYPSFLVPSFFVSFATDEDVQRTCGGNYWHYLK